MNEKLILYIDKIVLCNYGNFLGENVLELSPSIDKPITIIHGKNGRGKTTILNAVVWALYGKQKKTNINTDEGIINKHVIEQLNEGESAEAYVELWLCDNDGPQYHIKRTLIATKTTDGHKRQMGINNEARANQGISFELKLLAYYRPYGKNQLELVENENAAQAMISRIFPEKLSSYILFDAELLDEFLTQVDKDLVKKGIEEISGLPLIDYTANDLELSQQKIKQRLKRDIQLEDLIEDEEDMQNRKNEMLAKEKELAARLIEIDKQDERCQEFLKEHNENRIKDKEEQLRKIRVDKKILDEQTKKLREEFREFILTNYYRLNLRNELSVVIQKFQQWEKEGRIPPPISSAALDDMINSPPSECVCGRVINVDSPEMKKLKRLRKKIIDSVITQEISRGRDRLSIMFENSRNEVISESYSNFINKLASYREQYRISQAEEKEVLEYLGKHPVEEINKISQLLKKDNEERVKIGMDVNAVHNSVDHIITELIPIQKKIKIAAEVNEANKNTLKKIDLCVLAISKLHVLKQELLEDFKRKTEDATSKYFLEIASGSGDFGGVKILDGFELRVVDKNGLYKKLSAGQSHCLGLSYISAIRKITKQNYFVVIDSPLHNISQEERLELIHHLPQYLKTQLTLLVTDTEYTARPQKDINGPQLESVRDVIVRDKTLWREYLLDEVKNSYGVGTKIVEVNENG